MRSHLAALLIALLAAGCSSSHPSAPQGTLSMTQIPRINGVSVNGQVSDWRGQGLLVRAMVGESATLLPASRFDAVGRLGWNDQGILLQVQVTDTTPNEADDPNQLYQGDSVEFFLMGADEKAGVAQVVLSPGRVAKHSAPRVQAFDYRSRELKKATPPFAPRGACRTTANGYIADLLLPWSTFNLTPYEGRTIGVAFGVNNSDGKDRTRLIWTNGKPKPEWLKLPQVQLAAKPGIVATIAAWGGYHDFDEAYVNIIGECQYAAAPIEVLENGKVIGQCTLRTQRDRAAGTIRLPIPPIGSRYGNLTVRVAGRRIDTIEMPDLNKLRQDQFARGAWRPSEWGRTPPYLLARCRPEIFSGQTLPEAAYPEPGKIRALVGSYTISTDYYDAAGQKVTKASKPGRYGAVITVTPEHGKPWTAYQTLARADSPSKAKSAVDLAAKLEGSPNARKADRDWWHALRKQLASPVKYEYFARLPKSYDQDQEKRWPLIIYLHGSGGGEKMENVTSDGPQKKAQQGDGVPFIVVSLRSPGGWYPPAVRDVIDEVHTKYRTDPSRCYLTGFSMGGMGTWQVALDDPSRFAAIAPIGGRDGDPAQAPTLKGLAAWVINGADDTTTTSTDALKAVKALEKAGIEVKWTEIPEAGHVDSMNVAYSWDDLYTWFLQHHRPSTPTTLPVAIAK